MSIFNRFNKKSDEASASSADLKGLNILGRYYRLEDITPIRSAGGLILQGIDASSIYSDWDMGEELHGGSDYGDDGY